MPRRKLSNLEHDYDAPQPTLKVRKLNGDTSSLQARLTDISAALQDQQLFDALVKQLNPEENNAIHSLETAIHRAKPVLPAVDFTQPCRAC